MLPFLKFLRLVKVEEQADGTLMAWGLLTAEEPDQDDEVCDYASTVPYFKALVERYTKTTGAVDGMATSLYPVREMHQLIAAGCGKSIQYDDAAKTIRVGVHVVDPSSCDKVRKGVLIGFSQGGTYVKTWKKNAKTWYTADPGEVSLVDSPCLKRAVIDRIAEKSFTYTDKNGSTDLRKYVIEKTASPSGTSSPILSDVEIASYRALVKDDKAKPPLHLRLLKYAKHNGVDSKELAVRLEKTWRFLSSDSVQKGMWTVQETACIVDTLAWLQRCCEDEKAYEGDASTVPADLKEVLASLISAFIDMVDEETSELLAALKVAKTRGSANMTDEEIKALLAKAHSAKAHLEKLHDLHKDHCEKMTKAHGDHHEAMTKAHKSHMDKAHGLIAKALKAMHGEAAGDDDEADKALLAELAKNLAVKCTHDVLYTESCKECGRTVEKAAAAPAAGSDTFTKAQLEEELDKRINALRESLSTGNVRGMLVPRPGEEIIHLDKAQHASVRADDAMSDAGI